MPGNRLLVVLDFDGVLLNSYDLVKQTFREFGLDVGDEERFKKRRKFLKYLGGGKEFLINLVKVSLPKKTRIREQLTQTYIERGRVYPDVIPLVNELIAHSRIHCGILSRNFTLNPGPTIRAVLRNSGIAEEGLDFVIPIPVGVRKDDVMIAMKSGRYRSCLMGGDEIGDYRAATIAGYESVIASYGFDSAKRLVSRGNVPPELIVDTPKDFVERFRFNTACIQG